jgi:hypothetical protein
MTEPQSPDLEGGDAPNPESLVGSVLAGRYRLVKLLGWGAMGAVYVGEHLKIGRRDAIKVLKASLARDPEAVARFARGARNASAIRHPNVCTVYDFSDTSDGLQFLAMELVDGESLTSLLRREGPLSLDRAGRIAIQAASALQAAHDMGIVHRDMKPDNVMLTKDRDGNDLAKVVDFDIAKGSAEGEERGVTRMGFVVGTPEYMSPEQLTGDPLDGRSDVYSLGIVLFRMISGDLPYRARSTQELMVDRLTRDPLKLTDVAPDRSFPPAVQQVLDRVLARDREDRPENALAFARELWEAVYGPAAAAAAEPEAAAAADTSSSEPRTPEAAPAEHLPATVVAPRGDRTFTPPTPVPPPTPPVWKRLLPWGAAAALVVVVGTIVTSVLNSPGAPEPSEVRLPPTLAIQVGESAQVEATVRAADGSVLPGVAIQWTSVSPDVVTVDGRGVVRGVRAGSASVRAAAGELEGATEVTVSGPEAPTPPVLAHSAVAFSVTGGGSPRAQTVDVTGAAVEGRTLSVEVDYPAGEPDGWLSAELEGDTPPTRLRVQPVRAPSSPGSYRASVIVGWGRGAPADTIDVTLSVERASPPPTRRLTVPGADSLAWRQLFLLDDDQSASARRAVKDTTEVIWRDTSLPDSIRARAAFAHAQASVLLGEQDEGLLWAQRAVDAAPGDGNYLQYLQRLRGG